MGLTLEQAIQALAMVVRVQDHLVQTIILLDTNHERQAMAAMSDAHDLLHELEARFQAGLL